MALVYLNYVLSIIITLMILLYLFYELWFLRNPKRAVPKDDVIVSPANGRIARIIEVDGKGLEIKKGLLGRIRTLTADTTDDGWMITIVMTPLNVHYQRSPCDGRVIGIKYRKGKLLNAVVGAEDMSATLENEKNEILISTRYGRMKVIQIAGFIAKRIECFVRKNQNIKKGETIGIIKLGSQVCLIMPKHPGLKLVVGEGQHVVDGETVVAEKR